MGLGRLQKDQVDSERGEAIFSVSGPAHDDQNEQSRQSYSVPQIGESFLKPVPFPENKQWRKR